MTGPAPPSFSELAAEILRFDEQQQDFPIHSHDCDGGSDSIGSNRLEDVFTRFRLWVGNLGVLHKRHDPRGLDKRLQDAPEVAKRIRQLLAELKDLLREAKLPCKCNVPQTHVAPESLPASEEDALIIQLLGIETSSECTASWLLASLESTVRRLFTISSLIAKSTTRDKFARAEVNFRLQMYESYDISHVREKLKQRLNHNEEDGEKDERLEAELRANEWLANRLGRANTKRRQFIAYSQSHRDALNREMINDSARFEKAIENPTRTPGPDDASAGRSACFSEGVKSSIAQTKASTLADLDPNVFDYGQDDARSTTTVATSIMDGQSFSGLKVPQLVHFTEVGEHFVCPLCRTFQRFNGQEAWSKHVFSDIRAYICTSKDCGMSMFDSFSTWRGHEMEHRRRWSCPLCSTPCTGEAAIEAHLMQLHNDTVGPHNLDTLLRTSSHPSEFLLASDCPFCDWNAALRKRNPAADGSELSVPSKRFLKHLGKHLEELALFVVPQPEQDDEDPDQVGSDAAHAAEADDDATMSTLSSFSSKVSSIEGSPPPDASKTVVADQIKANAEHVRRLLEQLNHPKGLPVQQSPQQVEQITSILKKLFRTYSQIDKLFPTALRYPEFTEDRIKQLIIAKIQIYHNWDGETDSIKEPLSLSLEGVLNARRLVGEFLREMNAIKARGNLKAQNPSQQQQPQSQLAAVRFSGSSNSPPVPMDWSMPKDPRGVPEYGSGVSQLTQDNLKIPELKGTAETGSNTSLSREDGPSHPSVTKVGSTAILAHEASQDNVEGHKDSTNPILHGRVKRGDPPQAYDGKYYCNVSPDCADQYFDRKSEWSKHMDKHDRPYRCPQPQCAKLKGFTSSSGLVRHEREVHTRHGGPREVLRCPIVECRRHIGRDFSRMDGLVKHLAAVHGIKKSPAEIRRDRSLQSGSLGQEQSRESTNEQNSQGQDPDTALQDYQTELMIRRQQDKKRLIIERQEHDRESANPNTRLPTPIGNMGELYYKKKVMLLEQQNKKRLLMARQEQDAMEPQAKPYVASSAPMARSPFEQESPIEEGQDPWDASKTIPGAEERNMRLAILGDRENEVYIPPRQKPWHEGERLPGAHRILEGQPTALSQLQREHTTLSNAYGQGERLPGVQSILNEAPTALSEQRLEQTALTGSANEYDKIFRRVGDLLSSSNDTAAPFGYLQQNAADTIARETADWESLNAFEDMPGEELDRLLEGTPIADWPYRQMPLDNKSRLSDRATPADRGDFKAFKEMQTDDELRLVDGSLDNDKQILPFPSPTSSVAAVVGEAENGSLDDNGNPVDLGLFFYDMPHSVRMQSNSTHATMQHFRNQSTPPPIRPTARHSF